MQKTKILLIHGWNYKNYTSKGSVDAWRDRLGFTKQLSEHFEVVCINLPGFGGEEDPKSAWSLEDYVLYVDKMVKKHNPNHILGYSFGGAVVLHWKKTFGANKQIGIFLVSPAIIRKYQKESLSFLQKLFKKILPEKILSFFRDLYLVKVIKNPYYSEATPVMRKTYRNIVGIDLREELLNLDTPITLIFGEKDTATPISLLNETVSNSKTKHRLYVINNGGHDIANSHTSDLVSIIVANKEVPSSAF